MKPFISLLQISLLYCVNSWAFVLLKNDAEYLCQSICLEAGGGAEYDLDTNTCKCRLSAGGIDDADLEMLLKNTETLGLKLATVQGDNLSDYEDSEKIVVRKRSAESESNSASIEDVKSLENQSTTESSKSTSESPEVSSQATLPEKIVQKRQTDHSSTPATANRFQDVNTEVKKLSGRKENNNDQIIGQEAPRSPVFARRTTPTPATRRTFSLPTRSTTLRSTTKRSAPTPFPRRTPKPTERQSRFPVRPAATSARSGSEQTPLKTLQENLERMRKEREQRLRNGPKLQQRFGAEARQNLLDQIKERQQQRRARLSSTTPNAPVVGAVHSTTEAAKEASSAKPSFDIITQDPALVDGDNDEN